MEFHKDQQLTYPSDPLSIPLLPRTREEAAADREREWMNEAQATQARLKKQKKLIEKMQLQAGAPLFYEAGE